jgi:hypothetical protein
MVEGIAVAVDHAMVGKEAGTIAVGGEMGDHPGVKVEEQAGGGISIKEGENEDGGIPLLLRRRHRRRRPTLLRRHPNKVLPVVMNQLHHVMHHLISMKQPTQSQMTLDNHLKLL